MSETLPSTTAIVFVHFGKTIPEHLRYNIEGTINRFPNHEVCLVRDTDGQVPDLDDRLRVFNFRPSTKWPSLTHDARFWDNWWEKTFHRLLVLEKVHELVTSSALLHIESDVFLGASFPFQKLVELDRLAWPSHLSDSDIASVLFSPSSSHTRLLSRRLASLARRNPALTDMTALYKFRKEHPRDVYSLNQDSNVSPMVDAFDGVFDGANFGSYIFGSDPVAKAGLIFRRRLWTGDTQFLDGARFTVSKGKAEMHPREGSPVTIHNLHVHSKDLEFFRSQRTLSKSVDITPRFMLWFSLTGFTKWWRWRSAIAKDSIFRLEKWRELVRRRL